MCRYLQRSSNLEKSQWMTTLLRGIVLVLGLLVRTAWAQHDDSPTANPLQQATEQRVAALIAELDSEVLAAREHAERALLQLGPRILPLLPEPSALTSAESRVRLQRTLETLREREITDAIEPSTITLHGNYSINQVFQEFGIQTENRIQAIPNGDWEAEWNFDNTPFWQAFDAVLDRSNLELVPFGNSAQGLSVRPIGDVDRDARPSVAHVGVFRLQVASVAAKKNFLNPASDVLQLAVWLAWEPRSQPIFVQMPRDPLQGVLDDGSPLTIADEVGSRDYMPTKGSPQIELEMSFRLPSRTASKIGSIQGTFTAALPGKRVELDFDALDGEERQVQEVANLSVAVEPWRMRNKFHELRFRVRLEDAQRTTDSFRGWFFENEYMLKDANGNTVEPAATTTTGLGKSELSMTLLYQLEEDPSRYRFIYRAPGSVIERTFEFELRDIQLP